MDVEFAVKIIYGIEFIVSVILHIFLVEFISFAYFSTPTVKKDLNK